MLACLHLASFRLKRNVTQVHASLAHVQLMLIIIVAGGGRLRAHFRAPPTRSAAKGGHGLELPNCPRCKEPLDSGLPHVGEHRADMKLTCSGAVRMHCAPCAQGRFHS